MNTDDFYVQNTQAEEDAIAANLFATTTSKYIIDSRFIPSCVPRQKIKRVAKNKYLYTGNEEHKKQEKTMNTKLRLLVTDKCHNNCHLCCNKQFNFDELEVVDRWDYEEIMITGGEPLTSNRTTSYIIDLIMGIRAIWHAQGWKGKIYLYTSTKRADLVIKIISYLDGIVYTPHTIKEMHTFMQFAPAINFRRKLTDQSLRLNLFEEEAPGEVFKAFNYGGKLIQQMWQIKSIKWIPNCPVPEGEDFRRIQYLL